MTTTSTTRARRRERWWGMVLGLLPTIGVPLPLLSYGGTAMIAVMAGIGLVVGVRTRRFVN